MSTTWMVKAFSCKLKSAGRKLVLIKLADNANDEGVCWPSVQHIADHSEMSARTVRRHLKDLEEAGFIEIEKRRLNNFVNRSNLYRLKFGEGQEYSPDSDPSSGNENPPSDTDEPPKNGEQPQTSEANSGEGDNLTPPFQEGDNMTPRGDTVSGGEGDTVSPRTCHSFEPAKEPSSTHTCARESVFQQPNADTRPKFSMHENWQVSESFQKQCEIRGLMLEKLDPDRLADEVRDFVCYWMARSESTNTQSLWEHKLAQHLQRGLRRGVFNTEFSHGYANQSENSGKPKSAAQLHAESCAGAFDQFAGSGQGDGEVWANAYEQGETINGECFDTSGPTARPY